MNRKKKYETEEERLAAIRESKRKYVENNKDKIKEQKHIYYEKHKEERLKYGEIYRKNNQDKLIAYREQHKEEKCVYSKQYYQDNKERIAEQQQQYYQDNKERFQQYNQQYYQDNKERILQYRSTIEGMCTNKSNTYRAKDRRKFGTDENTVTPEQMLEMIETQPHCFYCNCEDLMQLGLDRIDNSKPHTVDNCVVACWNCNNERKRKDFFEFCKSKGIEI